MNAHYQSLLHWSNAQSTIDRMSQMIIAKMIRAYVRAGITRFPIDVQKHKIQQVADRLELEVRWYEGTAGKNETAAEERELWARQLRCNEIGLVHSLPVLRLTRKQIGGKDPKGDFAGLMASTKALYLMEADSGITSNDRSKWRSLVSTVTEKPPPGARSLTKAEASKLSKDGWATRNRGVKATWTSEAREKERKHLIRHWLASSTAKDAHATLAEFIESMDGGVYKELNGISAMTLRRIVDTPRK